MLEHRQAEEDWPALPDLEHKKVAMHSWRQRAAVDFALPSKQKARLDGFRTIVYYGVVDARSKHYNPTRPVFPARGFSFVSAIITYSTTSSQVPHMCSTGRLVTLSERARRLYLASFVQPYER